MGGAGDAGAKALEDMQAAMERRLESLGASTEPPPPPSPPGSFRSEFSKSNAAATNEAAAAALYRMRRRETGELEVEYAETIARAIRAANQWMDAKLPARALSELQEIENYMSISSEGGGAFHILLAKVTEANGNRAAAKRIWQRISAGAKSSSQRWQADQALGAGGAPSSSSQPANPEMNNLFGGFQSNNWD